MTIRAKGGIGFAGFAKRIVEGDMQPQYWCTPAAINIEDHMRISSVEAIEAIRKDIENSIIDQLKPSNHYSTKSIEEQREANRRLFDGKQ